MSYVPKENFEKQLNSQYKQDEFLDPWTLSFIDKSFEVVRLEVIDYTPKLVQPGQPFPEPEIISRDMLLPFIPKLQALILNIDPEVKEIYVNDEVL